MNDTNPYDPSKSLSTAKRSKLKLWPFIAGIVVLLITASSIAVGYWMYEDISDYDRIGPIPLEPSPLEN